MLSLTAITGALYRDDGHQGHATTSRIRRRILELLLVKVEGPEGQAHECDRDLQCEQGSARKEKEVHERAISEHGKALTARYYYKSFLGNKMFTKSAHVAKISREEKGEQTEEERLLAKKDLLTGGDAAECEFTVQGQMCVYMSMCLCVFAQRGNVYM